MSNKTKTSKNRSTSKFLGARRKSFLTKRNSKLGFSFLKQNKGRVTMSKIKVSSFNSYKCAFYSEITGRKAFAYGSTFHVAYQNMIRLFNLKYA
jgi:hypothetical protein